MDRDDEFWFRVTVEHIQVIEEIASNIFWNIIMIKDLKENLSNPIPVYSEENEVYCMYVFPVLVGVKSWSVKTYWYGVFEVFAQGFYSFFESMAVVFVTEGGAVLSEIFEDEWLDIRHQAAVIFTGNKDQSRACAVCCGVCRQIILSILHHCRKVSFKSRSMACLELSANSFSVFEFLLWSPSFLRS